MATIPNPITDLESLSNCLRSLLLGDPSNHTRSTLTEPICSCFLCKCQVWCTRSAAENILAAAMSGSPTQPAFSADNVQKGRLPPFEVAKAYAFDVVLSQMEKHMGKSACVLLGEEKGSFIAKNLTLKGGGHPTRQAVFQAIRRCQEKGWYPGKGMGKSTGRKPDISEHQKTELARVLMEGKRQLVKPTPAYARAKLPRLCINRATDAPISDGTIYTIMHTMCYDESEDDPWVYMYSPSKDFLSDEMKKSRCGFGEYFLEHFPTGAWSNHASIDPCISILPITKAQSDDQKVAAMGVKKMISPKSKYKGPNCRAPKTAKSQGRDDIKVHWTPVFALGKVYIYVCDAVAAARDPSLLARLNEGQELAKFVKNVLPGILQEMRDEHGWRRTPRTIVHDKASYMVAPKGQRLASPFAAALHAAKLRSWLGDEDDDCSWLAGRLGDVYPRETVISHIRRALDHRFPRSTPGETRARFVNRMSKVQEYMNSEQFKARDGGGLLALAESLRERCRRLVLLEGERLRT